MHSPILWTVVATSLVVVTVGTVTSIAGRTAGRANLAAVGLAELAALVQSAVAGAGLAGGHHVVSVATFVGYLVGILAILPFAVAWAWADRNRWSGAVIAIGGFAVAVMTARLQLMWDGRA